MRDLSSFPSILETQYVPVELLSKAQGKELWHAKEKYSDLNLIIKILRFDGSLDWQSIKLFEREAKVLQTLKHDRLPKVIDYVELSEPQNQGFAILLEKLPGKSLEQWVKEGRTFSEYDLKAIARQLLEILGFLHSRQPSIIHRDLKPSNILLSYDSNYNPGKVYLIDFGAVQTMQPQEGVTRTVVGTYGYMPPEQFGGRTLPASDLYSLGATLIFLATGQAPSSLLQEDMSIAFTSLVNLSPNFVRWIQQLVEPSLNRRFSEVDQALDNLIYPDNKVSREQQLTNTLINPRVSYQHTPDSFRLQIAPAGFQPKLLLHIPLAIAWNGAVFSSTIAASHAIFPALIWHILLLIPFWIIGLGLLGRILFILFGRFHLLINQTRITQSLEIHTYTIPWKKSALSDSINMIELVEQKWDSDSNGNPIKIPGAVVLWAGNKKFTLSTAQGLDKPDLHWLAKAYSDWLDIDITHR